MGNRIGERLQLSHRCLELDGLLDDTPLKSFLGSTHGLFRLLALADVNQDPDGTEWLAAFI